MANGPGTLPGPFVFPTHTGDRVPRLHALPLIAAAALAVTVACHSQPKDTDSMFSVRNVITQDQIDSSSASNVYELIQRLHSEFLKDRGKISIKTNQHERAVVFLNDHEYGILETMRNIPIGRVGEIRYFSGTEAVARFGSQYGGGVVQLMSRAE